MPEKIAITKEKIKKHLSSAAIPFFVYDTVGSTNDIAKELAKKGVYEAVVIAHHQNAGRGRRGRSFFSPDGCGIYMSILLHTEEYAEDVSLITSAAAVAVAEAVEKVSGKNVGIKWINDIYLDDKKACGILCESIFSEGTGHPEYTVVGIGINLIAPDGFPEEIVDIATSVFGSELPHEDIPSRLCAAITENVLGYAKEIKARSFLNRYKEKMVMLGKKITVHSPTESYPATALDIDGDCHLIVELEDGTKRTLSSGEISIKI